LGTAATFVAAPAALSLLLIAWFGRETRGRDLRELEVPSVLDDPSAGPIPVPSFESE
jgi:hypothetical protein